MIKFYCLALALWLIIFQNVFSQIRKLQANKSVRDKTSQVLLQQPEIEALTIKISRNIVKEIMMSKIAKPLYGAVKVKAYITKNGQCKKYSLTSNNAPSELIKLVNSSVKKYKFPTIEVNHQKIEGWIEIPLYFVYGMDSLIVSELLPIELGVIHEVNSARDKTERICRTAP